MLLPYLLNYLLLKSLEVDKKISHFCLQVNNAGIAGVMVKVHLLCTNFVLLRKAEKNQL